MPNNEPAAIPGNGPIPFAPVPTGVCFWPVRTSDANKRVVSFLGADGVMVGNEPRRFLAMRDGGNRYHAGVDLYGIPGDAVVACRDGKVANFYNFYENSYALLINHGDVVVNHSEGAADSLKNNGLRVGSEVKAGQRIGIVAQLKENGMCHFEAYATGTEANTRWMVGEERPRNLLNPTKLLLHLAEDGIGIDASEAAAKNRALGQSLEWQTKLREIGHALGLSAAPFGADDPALALAVAKWQCANKLGEDGVIGPDTWGSLRQAVGGSNLVGEHRAEPFTKEIVRVIKSIPAGVRGWGAGRGRRAGRLTTGVRPALIERKPGVSRFDGSPAAPMLSAVSRRTRRLRAGPDFCKRSNSSGGTDRPKEETMRMLVLLLIPALALALAPTLVGERPVGTDTLQFRSPGGSYGAKVEYTLGNTEFVPIDRFELRDRTGKMVYTRSGGQHTILDISDNGLVVGADFDGPVTGRAKLHFYDTQGRERGTADVGFWDRHGFSARGSVYCVQDGKQGLRVFTSEGKELYNAGRCNRFAVSADGRRVALATDEAILLLKDGVPTASVPISSPFVRQMAFSPDGERFGYCERGTLHLYRVRDAAMEFQYRPEDAKLQFISLDVGNELAVAGLDVDGGRGMTDRHRRGFVVLLDSAGIPVWQQELTYGQWNVAVPDVRFESGSTFRVRTADTVREYQY